LSAAVVEESGFDVQVEAVEVGDGWGAVELLLDEQVWPGLGLGAEFVVVFGDRVECERQVALGAAQLSFDNTVNLIKRTTGTTVGKRQAEELAQSAAVDFPDFYDKRKFEPGMLDCTGPIQVLSFDQKGVVLKLQDLRAATQKVAKKKQRKLQSRHSKGEPRGRKRMATVATVYSVEPYWRTPEDIIKGLCRIRDAEPKKRPRPELKRVWASLTESPQDIIRQAFEEALKRDPDLSKRWYVCIDGDDDLVALTLSIPLNIRNNFSAETRAASQQALAAFVSLVHGVE